MADTEGVMLPHGGYRRLRSWRSAEIVYDATVVFCDRFIERGSRTRDQMIQAARSGVQNIAEGSMAAATSKKTEMKLTSVARSSLEELLGDYRGYLRQHGLKEWARDSDAAIEVRGRYRTNVDGTKDPYGVRTATAEVAANTMICLVQQTSYLLGRQLGALQKQFLGQGGFTERMYQMRKAQKGQG
ncbi:MAG: four helix bundle protein [Deltaproteobacteria bacterium]|nr:four helix bundle protein [Deltaproteobacteria bacterium]